MLRRVLPFLVCSLCLAAFARPANAADVEFVRVWPSWRGADSFERIGEYFGRSENAGGDIVRRTDATNREGYYFLVRVKTPPSFSEGSDARFELSVIRPDTPEPKQFVFPVSLPAKQGVFQLGLTGADWPGGKAANPVAWKLALIGADNRVLAEHKSFLWEKPAKQ